MKRIIQKNLVGLCLFVALVIGLYTNSMAESVDTEPDTDIEILYDSELDSIEMEGGIPEELADFLNRDEYEVRLDEDESGYETWYLINNIEGTRIKISDMNEVFATAEEVQKENTRLISQIRTIKMIMCLLTVILSGALVGFIIMWNQERKRNGIMSSKAPGENKNAVKKTLNVDDYSHSGAEKYTDSEEQ